MALHAPLPAMAHESDAEWLASHVVCSVNGTQIASDQGDAGASHGGMMCCLMCASLDVFQAPAQTDHGFAALRGLQFAVPAQPPSRTYRHPGALLAPARAPPSV